MQFSILTLQLETNFSGSRQCRLAPSNYADILIMNIFDMAQTGLV